MVDQQQNNTLAQPGYLPIGDGRPKVIRGGGGKYI